MLTSIIPKLPMRNKSVTRNYYVDQLGFEDVGSQDFEQYLIVEKDNFQIHFFAFETLDPKENYGQIYIRTENIDELYQSLRDRRVAVHPNGHLENKPWQQREFSLLDPDNNLLTFGQTIKG